MGVVVGVVIGVVIGVVDGGGHVYLPSDFHPGQGYQLGSIVVPVVGYGVTIVGQSVGWSHAVYAAHLV